MPRREPQPEDEITLLLCGDVMLGRGIDQILAHPGDPRIYEPGMDSALGYVALAERAHGPIPRRVSPAYVWGDALAGLRESAAAVSIANLETCITARGRPWPKGINYRMNPANVGCLTEARLDCCVLANNHSLDWDRVGLLDSCDALAGAGIRSAGAGKDAEAAAAPALLPTRGGRVVVFALGSVSSGIPRAWAAGLQTPGVDFLDDLGPAAVRRVADRVTRIRQSGDLVVISIHWGANWGYPISTQQRRFAHGLIDAGACDILHGHSSHHPQGIEIYRDRLILYGCGDFLNDYEGIGGYEEYRSDLAILYRVSCRAGTGEFLRLSLRPFRMRNFRLEQTCEPDIGWLQDRLDRESAKLGTRVMRGDAASLLVRGAKTRNLVQRGLDLPQ